MTLPAAGPNAGRIEQATTAPRTAAQAATVIIAEVTKTAKVDPARMTELVATYGIGVLFAETVRAAAVLNRNLALARERIFQAEAVADELIHRGAPATPIYIEPDTEESRRDRKQAVLTLASMVIEDPSVEAPDNTTENVTSLMAQRGPMVLAADAISFSAQMLREHARTTGTSVGDLISSLHMSIELGLDSM